MKYDVINPIMKSVLKRNIIIGIIMLVIIIVGLLVGIAYSKELYKKSKIKAITFMAVLIICSVVLSVVQGTDLIKVYKDYKNKSYISIENGEFLIHYGTDTWEPVHDIQYENSGKTISLKIEEIKDKEFDTGKYFGDLVYSKESQYVLWYDLKEVSK